MNDGGVRGSEASVGIHADREGAASLRCLNAMDASDYTALKAAILQRYDINEETYRQRFRAAKIGNGESPPALATCLADLAANG